MSIRPDLSASTRRNLPIPPLLQVLVTLRFLATGAFHMGCLKQKAPESENKY
jgi:hypothetical protein